MVHAKHVFYGQLYTSAHDNLLYLQEAVLYLQLFSCRNNYAQLGAGIHTQSRAVLQVINSTFEGNRARISGAGISTTAYHSVEGSPETSFLVSGCNFIGNKDEDGAADTSGLLLQGVGSSLEASEFLRFGVPQVGIETYLNCQRRQKMAARLMFLIRNLV